MCKDIYTTFHTVSQFINGPLQHLSPTAQRFTTTVFSLAPSPSNAASPPPCTRNFLSYDLLKRLMVGTVSSLVWLMATNSYRVAHFYYRNCGCCFCPLMLLLFLCVVHVCVFHSYILLHSFIFVCFWMWNNYRYKYDDKTLGVFTLWVCVCIFHFIPSKFKQCVRLNCYFLSTLSTLTLHFHRISAKHNTHAGTHTHVLVLCCYFIALHLAATREGRAYTLSTKNKSHSFTLLGTITINNSIWRQYGVFGCKRVSVNAGVVWANGCIYAIWLLSASFSEEIYIHTHSTYVMQMSTKPIGDDQLYEWDDVGDDDDDDDDDIGNDYCAIANAASAPAVVVVVTIPYIRTHRLL